MIMQHVILTSCLSLAYHCLACISMILQYFAILLFQNAVAAYAFIHKIYLFNIFC